MIINNVELGLPPLRYRIWDDLHRRWFQGGTNEKNRQLQTDAISFFGEIMITGEVFHDQHEDGVWKDIGFFDMLNHLIAVPSTGCFTEDNKEIFWGDIFKTCEGGELAIVRWVDDGYAAHQFDKDIPLRKFLDDDHWMLEITGNIFENPELLEERDV